MFWAALCTGVVLAWQALTVNFNYQGDWSALFYTGAYTRVPPTITNEGTFRIANDPGFDGQFYHFIAHDPFLRKDTSQFVDDPGFRWRRILVPLMAWLLALGSSEYIDSTYAITILGFVFLGAFWLGVYCLRRDLSPALGIWFPFVPAALVSIDRFTVDVALAALAVGFVVEEGWRLFVVMAVAPLARETGLIIPLTFGLDSLLLKNLRGMALAVAAIVPYAAWLVYLSQRTATALGMRTSLVPFRGLWERTIHPVVYTLSSSWLRTAAVLDYIAVLAMWLSVALVFWALRRHGREPVLAAALFTATFMAFVSQTDVWYGAYTFSRTMSPVLIFLALIGLAARSWIYIVPLAMSLPRLLWQLTPQWLGIWHGLKLAARSLVTTR
ncbi:MAG TPA: hypothetical protein VG096_19400 [Bryobacteraceae bacterium]|jgi:hypothetical protein|nr:hypothetical protein [Bryobacteraceae bacterium]